MIRALLTILLGVLACCSSAKAQSWSGTGMVINCPLVNTTTFSAGQGTIGNSIISNCLYTLPVTAQAYYFVQGTITCGPLSTITLRIIVGNNLTYQNFGASFNGQITGSVLTVNSMITSPPFVILPTALVPAAPQQLYDAFSGSKIPIVGGDSPLWIVSQATSTEPGGVLGGKGTYNLNTSVGTPIAAETMWALPIRPNSVAVKSNTYEQLACQNGTTLIESFGGSLPMNDTGFKGYIDWVQVEVVAERIGGQPPQSASFTNGQIFIVMPSMLQGGFAQ